MLYSCVPISASSLFWHLSWTYLYLLSSWVVSCSGFCIPSYNGLPSHILSISCHMLAFSLLVWISAVFIVFFRVSLLLDFPLYGVLSFSSCFFRVKLFTIFYGFNGHFCTLHCVFVYSICTDGKTVYMCPCILLAIACAIDYWPHVYWLWYM